MRFVFLVIGIFAAALCSRTQEAGADTHASFSCDLDGDGHTDAVEFTMSASHSSCPTSYDHFTLSVNGTAISRAGQELTGHCTPVDLDTTDHSIELAITETGPSGDDATHFFRYSGGVLKEMGTLPGRSESKCRPLAIDGSGVVTAHCRGQILHTWYYACRYGIDSDGEFERIPEPLYPMGSELTLKQGFNLVEAIDSPVVAVELSPGDTITVISSDDQRWCLVETQDHRRGWFEVSGYSRLANGEWARDIFEGLWHLD